MNRTRRGSLAVAMALSLSAASITLAQGPGGRGGWGGRGGGGRSVLQLVQNPAVQEEISITDAQKAQIEQINTASRAKRDALFANSPFRRNRGGNNNAGGNNGAPGNRGQAPGGQAPGGAPGGFGPGGFGPGGPGGFGPGGPGGPGGPFGNMTDAQRQQMQQTRDAAQQLDKETETAVYKVLDPNQRTRVAQIKLQSQGLNAFRTPELIQKLNIPDDRATTIAEILDGQSQARRQQFGQMREVFAKFAAGNNNGPPSREQFQALRTNPDFQAAMTAQRQKIDASNATLEEQTKLKIGGQLTKKQKAQYAKLLGEPFDLAKLNTGRGGPGGPGGPNTANANEAGGDPPQPAASATKTPAATPAAPARRSLRERRGGASNPG